MLTNKFKIHVKIDINVYTRTLHIYTVSIMIKYYSCSTHCLFLLLCYDLQGVETIILCIYTCNLTIVCLFINPRRACAARVTVVVLCVCLSVYDYSRTTGYERYQHLQCYKGTKNKLPILIKRLRSRDRYGVKTSEKANMHNEHWLTSTVFSPFGAPWTNYVTKGICIQVQCCSKTTHDHVASL